MSDSTELHVRGGALFDALVELPGEQHAAALAEAAESEPEVARYAERLLRADADPGLRGALGEFALNPADENDPAQALGTTIGEYRVESLIGRGGMGAVYLGRRSDPAARVAIKFMTVLAAGDAVYRRFERETEWIASVDHPGIVRYRDSGVDRLGRPYLVMDFVDGRPLSVELPEIQSSVSATVDLVIQVARAIHHLHQRGLLHRDLKPENVLLAERDGHAAPIVIDLGIARALEQAGDETLAPGPVGTPDFMAPEQHTYPCAPDVRTDVYGLGAILFALLSGTTERRASSANGSPTPNPTRSAPTPPSAALDATAFSPPTARARARDIDRDLDAIVQHALAPHPDDRYPSADAFAHDLARWRKGLPVEARRLRPFARFTKLLRRRPAEAALAALALAAVGTAATAVTRNILDERRAALRIAEQVQISDDALGFLEKEVLYQSSPSRLGPDTTLLATIRAAAVSLRDQRDSLSPGVVLNVGATLSQVLGELDLSMEADTLLADLTPLTSALPEDDRFRLRFEQKRGRTAIRVGRVEEGRDQLNALMARLEALHFDDPSLERLRIGLLANTAFDLASVAISESDYAGARALLAPALERARSIPAAEELVVRVSFLLAHVEREEGHLDRAFATYTDLRATLVELQGPDGADLIPIDLNLGEIARDRGEHETAATLARRALDQALDQYAANHTMVITAEWYLILALEGLERPREAAALYVTMIDRSFDSEHPDPIETAADRDRLMAHLDALEPTGDSLFDDALDLLERRWDMDDPVTVSLRARLEAAR